MSVFTKKVFFSITPKVPQVSFLNIFFNFKRRCQKSLGDISLTFWGVEIFTLYIFGQRYQNIQKKVFVRGIPHYGRSPKKSFFVKMLINVLKYHIKLS